MLRRAVQHGQRTLTRPLSATVVRSKPIPLSSPCPSDAPPPAFSSPRQQAQLRIAQVDALDPRPVSPFLTDSYGRQHDYLRISLTEKCNLRCTYCMPKQGVPLLPPDHLLTTDEVERVAKLFVQNGVTKIRLTGGEPTVRKDLVDVVARLGQLPLQSLGMTSNGIALKRKLPALVRAGLTHLNLSLDTLDEFKYELMTRRRGFHAVMEALEVAKGLKGEGLRTKINVVVIRGVNDGEAADFVELTRDSDITVRFIEYMPFEDNRWSSSKLVPSADLLSTLSTLHAARGPLLKLRDAASDTTRAYRVPGYQGSFGFISSMTDHFCGTCSRLRVAADGGVKVCLFGPPVLALRPLLRSLPASDPSSDPQLMEHIGAAVWGKKFAHDGLGASLANASIRRASAPWPARLSAASTRPRATIPLHLLGATTSSPLSSLRLFSTSSRPAFSSSPSRLDDDLSRRSPSPQPTAAPPPADSPSTLTHIDPLTGKASMVSVSHKAATHRSATAVGYIKLNRRAWQLIDFGSPPAGSASGEAGEGGEAGQGTPTMRTKKGDVLSIAQLAGLMGAKHTALLIPLCHPLSLSHISVRLRPLPPSPTSSTDGPYRIRIEATAECVGPTGVEMEALTAASVAGLTVWDMCKAVAGEEMEMGGFRVVRKSGGRSGDWVRDEEGEEGE